VPRYDVKYPSYLSIPMNAFILDKKLGEHAPSIAMMSFSF
jgi:hypothetical protein